MSIHEKTVLTTQPTASQDLPPREMRRGSRRQLRGHRDRVAVARSAARRCKPAESGSTSAVRKASRCLMAATGDRAGGRRAGQRHLRTTWKPSRSSPPLMTHPRLRLAGWPHSAKCI
jgi:hypothetical protein